MPILAFLVNAEGQIMDLAEGWTNVKGRYG